MSTSKLAQFKYVPSKDKGVNADKQKILYGIVFPAGKAVEVPDDVAHKLRTKVGNPNDEFVEVAAGSVEKTEAELQREKELKEAEKAAKAAPEKLTPEALEDLKAKAAAEEARIAKVQADAKLGR